MTSTRPPALRNIVSVIHSKAALPLPAVILVVMGSLFSAFAGMLATAGWRSFGPDPEDYLTEYEAASLTALVGIQKLALIGTVGIFVLASVLLYVGAIVVTALDQDR